MSKQLEITQLLQNLELKNSSQPTKAAKRHTWSEIEQSAGADWDR